MPSSEEYSEERLREDQAVAEELARELIARFSGVKAAASPEKPIPTRDEQQQIRLGITERFVERKLPAMWRAYIIRLVFQEMVNFGPLHSHFIDPGVSEIMVNSLYDCYIESHGRLERVSGPIFSSEEEMIRILSTLAQSLLIPFDLEHPLLDARMPDGSRLNATIWPISPWGPTMTIRRFGGAPMLISKLAGFGAMTPEMVGYLSEIITNRYNVIVFGGTGSGKTTLVNALTGLIQGGHRIVTVEDVAELQVQRPHVVTLEAKPPDPFGKGGIPLRRLVQNALRMRPDRIIVGEVRGGEALDMLQAMNTGHDGSMSTLHANNSRDAMRRLENMVLMSGEDLPLVAIRDQIASAIHVLIGMKRLADGRRVLHEIAEVHGMEGPVPRLHPVWAWEQDKHVLKFRSEFLRGGTAR